MLGLGDYDSPSVDGDSPAAAAALAEEPVAPAGAQLSIVDYYDDNDGEEAVPPTVPDTGVLGVTLDDDAVQRATQRRVGGVQISVVKKPQTPVHPSSVIPADNEEGEAEPSGSGAPPAFVLPPSPTGSLPSEMVAKFRGLVEKTGEGYRVNEHIRNAKAFRNPDILEKLVAFFDVRECGTNYPPELYDPAAFPKDDYYEKLEETRRKWEERQARKPGEKMAFASGGVLNQPAMTSEQLSKAGEAARAAAAALASKPGSRKSKWDSGGDDPEAKRPHA
eukprot:Transcript_15923.p1 GENE.Transcript_15923~~Transcript_15923.p1  ORF type:complete len:277 (+),score=80.05 Transcript_15923:138-968(+)